MHLVPLISILLVSLLLAGCVTKAAIQSESDNGPKILSSEYHDNCGVEMLVHSSVDEAEIQTRGLSPERLSVLNWNIYKGQRENWAADFKRYTYRHDIVMIQEAHLDDELKSMLDSGHRYWTLNTAFYYKDKATGVMTASRVMPVQSCGQSTVEPFIRFPKTSLISYFPIEGMNENLLVANMHGINFTLGVGAYKEQIEKLYDAVKHHKGPVILAGDFNTWSVKRMLIVNRLAQRLSLESLDYTSHNRTIVFGNALDHVFYRGLEPIEHDTWYVTSSDHNPTRVSFRVKGHAVFNSDLLAREGVFDD